MTEAVAATAGGLLKAAREKQGIHIAALAASIKVTPRKLEALEHDRYDELPDMTFVRALAKTVCRTLKIEPEPVLALLPHQADSGTALAQVSTGLNQPFRERPARGDPPEWAVLQKPVLWGAGAVLLAALVVYLLPERALEGLGGGTGTGTEASDLVGTVGAGASGVVTEVIEAASAAVDTVHSVPSVVEPPASAAPAAASAAGPVAATAPPPVASAP
ncbi:MAG: helix-turn-helix domain-containing protein, partial [Aquincola tertiaricarbonis]